MKKNTSEFVARNNLVVDPRWQSPGARDRPLPAEHAEGTRVRASACEPNERARACARLRMIMESDEAREQV